MVRSPKKAFAKSSNTKTIREFQDFDYLKQLNETDLTWLARFSDEYYTASFEHSPTFVEYHSFIKRVKLILKNENSEFKREKYKRQLTIFTSNNPEVVSKVFKGKVFIQVSGYDNSQFNFDLRRIRSLQWYFMDEKGDLTTSTYYKYSNDNLQIHLLKDCNERLIRSKADLFSNGIQDDMHEEFLQSIEEEYFTDISPEDYLLANEEYERRLNLI